MTSFCLTQLLYQFLTTTSLGLKIMKIRTKNINNNSYAYRNKNNNENNLIFLNRGKQFSPISLAILHLVFVHTPQVVEMMRRVEVILIDDLSLTPHQLFADPLAPVLQRQEEVAAIQLGPLVDNGRIQACVLHLQRLDAGE